MDLTVLKWTREPESYRIGPDTVEIVTKPHTDLWQRTYYHFQNDNAPVLQMETEDSSFKAVFSNMQITECQWKAHDGQQPD